MESPIEEVFLEPSGVQPLNSAVEAIMNADMIVLGPEAFTAVSYRICWSAGSAMRSVPPEG